MSPATLGVLRSTQRETLLKESHAARPRVVLVALPTLVAIHVPPTLLVAPLARVISEIRSADRARPPQSVRPRLRGERRPAPRGRPLPRAHDDAASHPCKGDGTLAAVRGKSEEPGLASVCLFRFLQRRRRTQRGGAGRGESFSV